MSIWRDMPIRRKLMCATLFTSSSVLLLLIASSVVYETFAFRDRAVRESKTLGDIISASCTAALAFNIPDDATEVLSTLATQSNVEAACLYDSGGRLFARYPADAADSFFPERPDNNGGTVQQSSVIGFYPVAEGNRHLGTLYIHSNMDLLLERLRSYGLIGALVVLVAILLAYFLSILLQRQISAPITALATVAQAVSDHKDYSVRGIQTSNDEIGALTATFNQMLDQIQSLHNDLERRVNERTIQLEAANKELEAFSYSVSHDLRAPLRHIAGFAQLLEQNIASSIDTTAQHYLRTIQSATNRLGTLIDELLVFSRMGRTEMRNVKVDMRQLIEDVKSDFSEEINNRRINWIIGDLPDVRADPAMMRQVWANLLGNAIKYTRQNPVACIRISHQIDIQNGHVFRVQDDGAGFDMKYVDKLFGVFQRLHTESEFEGTGIGLANVQRIIFRHGGQVWAHGCPGKGATFSFSLPAESF